MINLLKKIFEILYFNSYKMQYNQKKNKIYKT